MSHALTTTANSLTPHHHTTVSQAMGPCHAVAKLEYLKISHLPSSPDHVTSRLFLAAERLSSDQSDARRASTTAHHRTSEQAQTTGASARTALHDTPVSQAQRQWAHGQPPYHRTPVTQATTGASALTALHHTSEPGTDNSRTCPHTTPSHTSEPCTDNSRTCPRTTPSHTSEPGTCRGAHALTPHHYTREADYGKSHTCPHSTPHTPVSQALRHRAHGQPPYESPKNRSPDHVTEAILSNMMTQI